MTATTIGSWAHDHGYTTACLQQLGDELLVVCEQRERPDDPNPDATVIATYPTHARRLAEAAATGRVLAHAGRLQGAEPEHLAESPVRGQALRQLRDAEPIQRLEPDVRRDGQPVHRDQARRMFAADLGRYLHVGARPGARADPSRRTPR